MGDGTVVAYTRRDPSQRARLDGGHACDEAIERLRDALGG